MKKLLVLLMAVGVTLAWMASFVMADPGDVTDPDVLMDLSAVRQATARYHDVNVAMEDGYVSAEECVENPVTGYGMGIHYFNPELMIDCVADPSQPEILLYVPTGNGKMELVGVEYFEFEAPIGACTSAPILFDQDFHYGTHGLPPHWDLHAWVWQANPDGMFEEFNRNVKCPEP